jgi:hypothetical protein
VPGIIDYSVVLARMTESGLRCNYPNGGAFGFHENAMIRGWIGAPDPTIKQGLASQTQTVLNPAEAAGRVWREALAGAAWIMPASHWHFELHDASSAWLAGLLGEIGVDARLLENRADGAAIEFGGGEIAAFTRLLGGLLDKLQVSDFTLAFPGRPVLCLVHHHRQLWWSTTDAALMERIAGLGR